MVDVAELRMIRAVADARSFSGAARTLGYSQPAVGQRIRRLEARLGVTLVLRQGRRLMLTEAAEILLERGSAALALLESAEREIASLGSLGAGRVRVVAFSTASAALVPRTLDHLRQRTPNLTLTFREARPEVARDLLVQGAYDIAVVFRYSVLPIPTGNRDRDLVRIRLFTEDIRVALPRSHRLAGRRKVRLADLADEDWIAGLHRPHLEHICRDAGFEPRVTHQLDDHVAAQALVAAGFGVALLPALSGVASRHPDLVFGSLSPTPTREVLLETRQGMLRIPAVAETVNAFRHVGAELRAPIPGWAFHACESSENF
ncbi:MAG: LysR family transcriptional regulator [Gaiella sp.]|nr:LysR family transcriptional regulator [Gaiella sp.]